MSGARAARAAGGGRASQRDSANEGGKTLPVLPEALAVGLWPGNSEVSICCDAGLWDIHYIRADPCDAAERPEIY